MGMLWRRFNFDARAVGAGLVGLPPLTLGARVAFLGDSIFQQNHISNIGSGTNRISSRTTGEIAQAQALSPRFRIDTWPYLADARSSRYFRGANHGVNGATTDGALARVPEVIAMQPHVCVVCIGTNNLLVSTAYSDIVQICALLRAARIRVVLCTVRPWSASRSGDSADLRAAFGPMNAKIRSLCAAAGYTLCDLAAAYGAPGDFVYSDDAYFGDGLHPLVSGATTCGAPAIRQTLDSLIPEGNIFLRDLWTLPNLMVNGGILTGTAGGVTAPATGQSPTGMRITPSGTFNSTVTSAVEANADTGGQSWVITVTPGGTQVSEQILLQPTVNNVAADLAGKWVRSFVEIETDGWANWNGFQLQNTQNPTAANGDAFGLAPTAFTAKDKAAPWSGKKWIATPAVQFGSDATAVSPALRIYFSPNGASGVGVLRVRRWWCGVVDDPRPLWNVAVA